MPATADQYPVSRADQIAFTNRVAYWIHRLNLQDWTYQSIEWRDEMDCNAQVLLFVDPHSFRLQIRTYWDFPACEQNFDYIVCHELLHVLLAPMWKAAEAFTPPHVDKLIARMEHEAIARLTNALAPQTLVVRGIPDIEEVSAQVNPAPTQVATPEGDKGPSMLEVLAQPTDWQAKYGTEQTYGNMRCARCGEPLTRMCNCDQADLQRKLNADVVRPRGMVYTGFTEWWQDWGNTPDLMGFVRRAQMERAFDAGYAGGVHAAKLQVMADAERHEQVSYKRGYADGEQEALRKYPQGHGRIMDPDDCAFAVTNRQPTLSFEDYTRGLGVVFGGKPVGTFNFTEVVALIGWIARNGYAARE